MEQEQGFASVREQLIIAGIKELEHHGMADFSLRRVATACNLSCAAPYKHFRSKEDLIAAIFVYIREQLQLLLTQVTAVYANEPRRQLVESGIAYIRFCLANPHFRAVMLLSGDTLPLTAEIEELLHRYTPDISAYEQAERSQVFRSLIYGTVLLMENGELHNTDETVKRIRHRLAHILDTF